MRAGSLVGARAGRAANLDRPRPQQHTLSSSCESEQVAAGRGAPWKHGRQRSSCASVASASRVALEGTIDMFYESIADEVSGVRVPTLVIAGAGDPILTPDYVRRFVVESIPGARLITLPCGHEVPIEMPKETAWILQAFVAGLQEHAAEAGTA
jgi:pimeloyl-ACP methyl ester carboxylesterase